LSLAMATMAASTCSGGSIGLSWQAARQGDDLDSSGVAKYDA
jgi:hypothetical protein